MPTDSRVVDHNSNTAKHKESMLFPGQDERHRTAELAESSSIGDNADLLIVDDLEDTIDILEKEELND